MPRKEEPVREGDSSHTMDKGTDIFTLDGVNYLLIVDYTSKFPVV